MTVPSGSLSAGSLVCPVASRSSSREPLRRNRIGLPWPAITFSYSIPAARRPPAPDGRGGHAGRHRHRDRRTVSGSRPSSTPSTLSGRPRLRTTMRQGAPQHQAIRGSTIVLPTPSLWLPAWRDTLPRLWPRAAKPTSKAAAIDRRGRYEPCLPSRRSAGIVLRRAWQPRRKRDEECKDGRCDRAPVAEVVPYDLRQNTACCSIVSIRSEMLCSARNSSTALLQAGTQG